MAQRLRLYSPAYWVRETTVNQWKEYFLTQEEKVTATLPMRMLLENSLIQIVMEISARRCKEHTQDQEEMVTIEGLLIVYSEAQKEMVTLEDLLSVYSESQEETATTRELMILYSEAQKEMVTLKGLLILYSQTQEEMVIRAKKLNLNFLGQKEKEQ